MNATMQQQQDNIEVVKEEMTPEQQEAKREELARRQGRLDAVVHGLQADLDEAIVWRDDAERQWLIDLEQYDSGHTDHGPSKGDPTNNGQIDDYRRTGDNITRPAVLLATSRISDMLFPTSDRNWDITPSPDAKLIDFQPPTQDESGQPLTPEKLELAEQEEAERRCGLMRTQIDDQLQEANYDGIGRSVIKDACLYGTGVLRGPVPSKKLCRKPDANGVWRRQYMETFSASAYYVDLFQFYPRPCRNIRECPGVFELELLTPAGLRALANEPGFSPSQISRALQTACRFGSLAKSALFMRANGRDNSVLKTLENRYAVWKYVGEMKREVVIDFTVGLLEESLLSTEAAAAIISKLDKDELLSVNCEVWFCNGIAIKVVLSNANDNVTQYHVFCYEERPDTVFGKSMPFVLRDDQLAAHQLWQAMMLNAFMSAGLQIAVLKGALQPSGEGKSYDMTFTRPRVWEFTDEVKDIREAFQAWNAPSVIAEIMPMYERSKQNAQEHALLPAIAQGDATSATPTSSGLSMLMNAANIVTRQLAKAWDDDITTPLINAMYDWNLAHGKPEAKGDYTVIPRGVSHLLVKDVQAQRFLFALQTYSANPEMAKRMKWGEWAKMGMTVMDMDATKLMKDEEVVKQEDAAAAQNPPQDPRVLAEQNKSKQLDIEAQQNAELNRLRQLEIETRERTDIAIAASKERIAGMNYMAALANMDEKGRAQMAELQRKAESDGMWGKIEIGKMVQKERSDQFEAVVEAHTAPGPRLA